MDFAAIVATMNPAMVVVTASDGAQRSGCLVGFHSQCSIERPRYCVWISTLNHTHRVAKSSSHLAIHVLDERDGALARLFGGATGDEVDKFARCSWRPGPGGVPILDGCRAGFVGRCVERLDALGDHDGFVLAPDEGWLDGGLTPLRLGEVADVPAGHPAPHGDESV
jgi:flavin reductase (DIM6/NTAB) family NADH-FMN oxidoreductase RutF